MTLLIVLGVAVATFLTGAAVFFGWYNGIQGILISPILSLFAWQLWPLCFVSVGLMWLIYSTIRPLFIYRVVFVFVCGLLGFTMSYILYGFTTPRSQDIAEPLRLAFTVAGIVAGTLIAISRRILAGKAGGETGS